MENKTDFEKGDKVSVTFRTGRKWTTLFGKVDAVNGSNIRVRHKATWDKSKTTCGWFPVTQVEPIPEHWTGETE